jgi:copper homeostasis protein (lipoprotein)
MNEIRIAGTALTTLLAASCVVVPPSQIGGQDPQKPSQSAVVNMIAGSLLPALYSGDLPCADCAGIRYAIDLRPNNVFFMRTTYLGKGADGGESFDDIGRWSLTTDARTLILKGGRESTPRFYFDNSETLRLVDKAGQPIESTTQNYLLKRVPSYVPLEPKASMRGMYSYMADAGRFRECLTGLDLPVEQSGDNRALESAYTSARKEAGQPVLATLEGQIAQRPKMEGQGRQETLIVTRFSKVSAGESCD